MKSEYFSTIHKLISAGHHITDAIGRELKEYGISEPQYNVLRTLKDAKGKPLTVQDLQEKMVQRSSNITRIVDKLLERGLVDRQICVSNRRKMDISMTKEGLAILKKLDLKVAKFHRPLMEDFSEDDLKTLSRLISKIEL